VSPILVGSWQWVVVWPFDWHGGGVPEFLEKELELLFPTYKGVQKYATRRTSYSFPKMTAIIFTAYF